MNQRVNQFVSNAMSTIAEKQLNQFSFPSPLRAVIEIGMFAFVFLGAGYTTLGLGLGDMLVPMVPVLLVIMLCYVASGVYRRDITHSILNLYIHSTYGFVLATVGFVITIALFFPAFLYTKFIFFFLFFSFFVSNTIRPLISGTDFMDGGGRRTN